MIKQLNLFGVYVHPFMAALILGFAAARPTSKLLNHFNLYNRIWHPGLFDIAIFILIFGLLACLLVPDILFTVFE